MDSITVAQQLRGCTHITGSLEIQIRGGSMLVIFYVFAIFEFFCFRKCS